MHSSLRNAGVPELTTAATQFLSSQSWCGQVLQVTPVFAITGVVGVYRASLIPSQPNADIMVWLVVGDLPPAYIAHEPGDSWQDALIGYVTEMERWVDVVRNGEMPGDDIIPVNVPATAAFADRLASRLAFIRARFIDVDPDSVESDV
jgi:hypothetical protein